LPPEPHLLQPGVDGGRGDEAAYRVQFSAPASTIAQIAPEVLAVQEVSRANARVDLGAHPRK
jgi:hypothetical protein